MGDRQEITSTIGVCAAGVVAAGVGAAGVGARE